jgi:hypothetical protein
MPLAPFLQAQTNTVNDRFTFVPANAGKVSTDASKAAGTGEPRFSIVITRWSTDTERDRVFSVVTEEGASSLRNALWSASSTGWITWPGNDQYTVRYARRAARADGGEDVVLVTDFPLWIWWDPGLKDSGFSRFSVIHLRLNRGGTGQGTVSLGAASIRGDKNAGVLLADDAALPTVFTDVRHERQAS